MDSRLTHDPSTQGCNIAEKDESSLAVDDPEDATENVHIAFGGRLSLRNG